MATAMQVILLEYVEKLGNMGETVRVKPGYARNFLLPQGKALRATKDNVAYFEAQKAGLLKLNADKKAEAEKLAKKLEGTKVVLIRMASENGQLYGSVNSRDIADALNEATKQNVNRNQVVITNTLKTLGLAPVTLVLHPEVRIEIIVNIARSAEEAKVQEQTGKALVAATAKAQAEAAEADKAAFLDDSALALEKEWSEEEAAEAAAKAEKAGKKAEKKAAKKSKADSEEADAPAEIG